MDFANNRRPVAKYGKNVRRVLVHDLFEHPSDSRETKTSTHVPISPSSPGQSNLPQEDGLNHNLTSGTIRPAHVTSHSSTPASQSSHSPSVSPTRACTESSTHDASLYDMASSDEDSHSRTLKRRKLVQMGKERPAQESSQPRKLKRKPENLPLKRANVSKQLGSKNGIGVEMRKESLKASKDIQNHGSLSVTQDDLSVEVLEPSIRLNDQNRGKGQHSPQLLPALPRDGVTRGESVPSDSPSYVSDHSKTSTSSQLRTPKRKRPGSGGSDTPVDSPSLLGLTDLRLTPERSPRPVVKGSQQNSPSRGRSRLIDRLDAPSRNSDGGGGLRIRSVDAAKSPKLYRKQLAINDDDDSAHRSTTPSIPRSHSSQTRQTYGKTRTTYAKERSHLADMVDDIGGLDASSSQEASQQLASQLAATTGSSQLQHELNLDDESDEGPSGRLKSIHELRQAGTNKRFDRELESLLEDIDPDSGTPGKSLRIQALMKLIHKLNDASFLRFFLDHALTRIGQWILHIKDATSSVLIGIALWKAAHAERSSSKTLLQIFTSSTKISHILIQEPRSLTALAKSRDQNLSKSLSKDLLEFERRMIDESLLPAHKGSKILPAVVALGALNDALRGLAELQKRDVSIPHALHERILNLLEEHAQALLDNNHNSEETFAVQLALSFLEISSGPMDDDLGFSKKQYRHLGQSLASMVGSHECDDINSQSALRFVLSLSNNRKDICETLGDTSLIEAIGGIVGRDFLTLATQAECGQGVDEKKLDTVILSLGCLLNLTECANSARDRISMFRAYDDTNPTLLARFVDIFNQKDGKLSGATNADEVQVLVAFGYLSMLLCTLSLDESIRIQITQLLQDKKFEDVIVAAKTLLIHLQTLQEQQFSDALEAGEGPTDGGAIGNLSERFGQILSAITII